MSLRSWFAAFCLCSAVVAIGCGANTDTASDEETPVPTVPVEFPADTPLVIYEVSEMHCEGCASTVDNTLKQLDGVKMCYVDFDNRTATVAVEDRFDEQRALKIIQDSGYPKTKLVSDGRPAGPDDNADNAGAAVEPDSDGEFTVSFE